MTGPSMKPHVRYPGIAKAALEIAYDNGGINRHRTEAGHRRDLNRFLDRQTLPVDVLVAIDGFLSELSDDDLLLVTAGEQSEAEEFLRTKAAPPFLGALLNDIFEKVG